MKLKQSIRYQLADYKAGILVYYCAVVALYVVMYLVHIFLSRNVLYLNGGISAFSAIFLFICGLCSLHDNCPCTYKTASAGRPCFWAGLLSR